MNVRLTTLRMDELDAIALEMRRCSATFRMLGMYVAMSYCSSIAMQCEQVSLSRETEAATQAPRQLSLVPPGAYDGPA
jgi:hypothetical protein